MQIPLFPLGNVVLPGGLLPLRLFERRYIDMITQCLKDNTGFGVCLIESGLEAGKPAKPYPIGCTVSIVDFDQGDDGLLHISAQGRQEFRLLKHSVAEDELLVGEVELFSQNASLAPSTDIESLAQKLDLILDFVEPNIRFTERSLDNPDWVCYRLLELLPLSPASRYELLNLEQNTERVKALAALRIELARR